MFTQNEDIAKEFLLKETEPLEEQQEEQVIVKSPIQHHGLQRQTSITPTNLTNDMVNQYSRKP